MDMIIQTRSLFSDIPRQIPLAGADLIDFPQKLDRILHGPGAGVRTEIPALVLFHRSVKKGSADNPRSTRHFDKRIGLVIFEHRIVFRAMLLDQVALQDQCLQLRIGHDILETPDPRHHLIDLGSLVPD